VIVYKKKDKFQVKTYFKPTNKQLYIKSTSHHPPGATKGVALGEAIRYLRTNTEKNQFYKMMFLHKRNLLKRGYPRSLINDTMRKVKFSMRENTIKPKTKKTDLRQRRKPQKDPLLSPDTVQEPEEYLELYKELVLPTLGPHCNTKVHQKQTNAGLQS